MTQIVKGVILIAVGLWGVSALAGESPVACGDVFFAWDQWSLTAEAKSVVRCHAQVLATHPDWTVRLAGHTDERRTTAMALVLGDKQAKAVRWYFTELGVDAARITSLSYGKDRPFCTEHTEACRQQNRRVHITYREREPAREP